MRTFLISTLFLIGILAAALPATAHAELVGPLDPIIPEACKCETVQVQGTSQTVGGAPGYGCVLQVIQNVVRFAVSLGIMLATLALVYTGFQWITAGANAQKKSEGKNLFLNTLVGMVLILTAWLIVDYVMKTLYREPAEFGPWNSILASTGNDQCLLVREPEPLTDGTVGIATGPTPGGGGIGVNNPGSMTDSQARQALRDGGVEIYDWGATRTLANTRINTINQALEIKKACNCRVLVTATTGGTHSTGGEYTHANGYKIDLEDTADLNKFLQGLRRGVSRGGDARYYDRCGNEYVYENAGQSGSHWDIGVTAGVCSL